MRLLRREICCRGEFRTACASTSRAAYRRLQSSIRRVIRLGFSGLEGDNGVSRLDSREGVEGIDVGVSVGLPGRDGGMVPRAAAIYSTARLSRLLCEMSK